MCFKAWCDPFVNLEMLLVIDVLNIAAIEKGYLPAGDVS